MRRAGAARRTAPSYELSPLLVDRMILMTGAPPVVLGPLDDYLVGMGSAMPSFDGAPGPTRHSRAYDMRVGAATHRVLARAVPQVRELSLPQAAPLLQAVIAEETHVGGRLAAARTRIAGMCAVYLRDYLPPVPATFMGAETRVGNSRIDLAWDLPDVGVFFDEIKTYRQTPTHLDTATAAQVARYLQVGGDMFGTRFIGVRLLMLANRHASQFLPANGAGASDYLERRGSSDGVRTHPSAAARNCQLRPQTTAGACRTR